MNIASAKFAQGVIGSTDIVSNGKKQIAFAGRSNVGKSSLMNSLLGRKDLVKSSSTPGKTKEANFFLINGEFYFVDLPGYGYAKLGHQQREKLRKLILWYLTTDEVQDKLIVVVIDSRVGPTNDDLDLIELLQEEGVQHIIVANKMDKLNQKELHQQKTKFAEIFDQPVFFYSSTKHRGRDQLWGEIKNFVPNN